MFLNCSITLIDLKQPQEPQVEVEMYQVSQQVLENSLGKYR